MHLLRTLALLTCVALPSSWALDTTNTSAASDAPALPAQLRRDCYGSQECYNTGSACQKAAARYEDDRVYKDYTSYVRIQVNRGVRESCTAIWACDDGKYGDGMTGQQIKSAFDRLWNPKKDEGKSCNRCGSSYLANGCQVTANYCWNCKDVGD